MSRHLSIEQVQQYRERSLMPDERLKVSDHIEACSQCRRLLQEGISVSAALQAWEADLRALPPEEAQHLSYEEMAAYLDGNADAFERSCVEEHIATCSECTTQLQELQSFQALLFQYPDEGYAPEPSLRLQDTTGVITLETDGTLHLEGIKALPRGIANWVRDLVTTGLAVPVKSMRDAMVMFSALMTPMPMAVVRGGQIPILLSPLHTAIRSTRPTLKWEGVPDAEDYIVTLVHQVDKENRKLLWKGSAGVQLNWSPPDDITLEAGQSYLWQVTAVIQGESLPSPLGWFVVLATKVQEQVEQTERQYADSALVRAGVYEIHGLYEEAFTAIEILAGQNPENPIVQQMRQKLLEQWNHGQSLS